MQMKQIKQCADILCDSLLETLNREIEIYQQIRDLMLDEKKILMKPSLEKLHENNARKDTLILKAKLLEEVRGSLVNRIASAMGISAEEVTLSALVSSTAGNQRKMLKECQAELHLLVLDIQRLNEVNKALIDTSLLFLGNSVHFMNDLLSSGSWYLETGKMNVMSLNGKMLSIEG
jgi:hypothetical protein